MNSIVCVLAGVAGVMGTIEHSSALAVEGHMFRPPAVPLVTHDPYLSIWSPADHLTDCWPTHWTGHVNAMQCMVRLTSPDGAVKTYRLMGPQPDSIPAMHQTALEVRPTTTIYTFEEPGDAGAGNGVKVTIFFCSPLFSDDVDLMSRPLTYITWEVSSSGGAPVDATIRFDLVGECAVDHVTQRVEWNVQPADDKPGALAVARIGSADQHVLARKGDDLRIDWGHAYLAAPASGEGGANRVGVLPADLARVAFWRGNPDPAFTSAAARPARDEWPALTATFPLGTLGPQPKTCWAMVAYDDEWSIQYFGQNLRPYWRRDPAMNAQTLLAQGSERRDGILKRAAAFDRELSAELTRLGGEHYAQLGALAWRQAIAGNKIAADAAGKPLLFPKENFSNGCICTVDVIYPMAPIFLATCPDLAKAMLIPALDYGSSSRWKFPFAPHDLGTYPQANGQVYGGGEKTEADQMPVEESANLVLLTAALAKAENSTEIADKYWPALTKWAEYLREKGFDPEDQLCTDDFSGRLAHNVNLSAKAILAIGAYGWLMERKGDASGAAAWTSQAKEFAQRWVKESADGDHTVLAFGKPDTWSQKYNLVWDDVLGLNLFPAEVKQREIAFYLKTQQPFGLPLDNRADFTKTDWTHWSACLSTNRADFEALIEPLYRSVNETPDRVPLSDWTKTKEPTKVGFVARPVVGGYFMPMLRDPNAWKQWFARGSNVGGPASGWAPLPVAR